MNMLMMAEETVSTSWIDGLTSSMFTGVLDDCIALVPILLPTIIGFLGFRKAWQFIKSQIQGA